MGSYQNESSEIIYDQEDYLLCCDYCSCRANDPAPGMRVGAWASDPVDHQGEISYTWTGNSVVGNSENMNPVPPVGDQFRQQRLSGRGPAAGVDER